MLYADREPSIASPAASRNAISPPPGTVPDWSGAGKEANELAELTIG